MNSDNKIIRIGIIGAGISGLSFSKLLKEKLKEDKNTNFTLKIEILEARDRIGGRIWSLDNFHEFPVELGAEEVHGENSDMYEISKKYNTNPFDYWNEKETYVEFNNEINTIENLSDKYLEVKVAYETYLKIMGRDKITDFKGLSMLDYFIDEMNLKSKETNKELDYTKSLHIIHGLLGVECATDLKNLCPKVFNDMELIWKSGDKNFVLTELSYKDILKKEFEFEIINEVILNKEVKSIKIVNQIVSVIDIDDNVYEYDYIISSIPIPVLKNIEISPNLSNEKLKAMDILKPDDTAKLILIFKEKFWPDDMGIIYLNGSVPVFWPSFRKEKDNYMLTGMTSGEKCRTMDELYKNNPKGFIELILSDLSKTFNDSNISSNLVKYVWNNWKNDKYALGGYTYHTLNEEKSRSILFEPHMDRLFFIGDAFAPNGHISTVHGSYECSKKTVEIFVKYLK